MVVHGIYIHSSRPKAISENGVPIKQWIRNGEYEKITRSWTRTNINNSNRKRTRFSPIFTTKNRIEFTRAQIRIWIHEKNLGSLEKIIWSGNGQKLLLETTNSAKVRRFLNNVPYLMNLIKNVHISAITNDVNQLKDIKNRTEISEIFSAKDFHGLTPIHKASGLGNMEALQFLLYENNTSQFKASIINETDSYGLTALHYSSGLKDSMAIYNVLLENGADETICDNRGKTADYYKSHTQELDGRFLRHIPDAPRVSGSPSGWERFNSPGGSESSSIITAGRRRISDEFQISNDGSSNSTRTSPNLDEDPNETEVLAVAAAVENNVPDVVTINGNDNLEEELPNGNNEEETPNENGVEAEEVTEMEAEEGVSPDKEIQEADLELKFEPEDESPEPPEDNIENTGENEIENETNIELDENANGEEENPVPEGEENELVPEEETVEAVNAEENENNQVVEEETREGEEQAEIEAAEEVEAEIEENAVEEDAEAAEVEDEKEPETEIEENTEDVDETTEAIETVEETEADVTEMEEPTTEIEGETPQPEENEIEEEELKNEDEPIEEETAEDEGNGEEETAVEYEEIEEKEAETENEQLNDDECNDSLLDDVTSPDEEYDDEIDEYLKTGNMEKLIEYVLEGRGQELAGRTSENLDIQGFIQNINKYLDKIASIHSAASNNNLKELQDLIDRSKLTHAKDENGLTPIHLSIIYGNVEITRFLASNYPSCLEVIDKNGRTPLHISAITNKEEDNGELYQELVDFGADPSIRDCLNNTPDIYLRNKELVTMSDITPKKKKSPLLMTRTNSVAATEPEEVAADADEEETSPESPPPDKGKKSSKSPPNPSSPNLLKLNTITSESANSSTSTSSTISPSKLQELEIFYTNISKNENVWARTWKKITGSQGSPLKEQVQKYLTNEFFNQIKWRVTSKGTDLLDVIKFFPQFFLIAPNPESYQEFEELFKRNIHGVQHINSIQYLSQTKNFFNESNVNLKYDDIPIIDIPSKFIKQVRLRLCRNIKPFSFLSTMSKEDFQNVNNIIKTAVGKEENWVDLEGLSKTGLQAEEWAPTPTKVSRFWPKYRSFSHINENFLVWINGMDHLDIVIFSRYGRLVPLFQELHKFYRDKLKSLNFYSTSESGFLTSDILYSGSGMKITFRIRLPTLMKEPIELKTKCDELKLIIKLWNNNRSDTDIAPEDWIEIENLVTVGNEIDIAKQMADSMIELIKEEEKMAKLEIESEKNSLKKLT